MDIATVQRFEEAAQRAGQWLSSLVQDDGSIASDTQDLAAYYKLPYLLSLQGKSEQANRVLDFVNRTFSRTKGGFETKEGQRSADERLNAYVTHMDAWLSITAQRMGRFDIAYPTFRSLREYYDPEQGAFTAGAPYGEGESVIDCHATTLMGWVSLYFGDLNKAKRAGNFLSRLLSLQPALGSTFYLRMTDNGQLITAYQNDEAIYYALSLSGAAEEQAYDIIGYAAGVLSKLYAATGEKEYLSTARSYLEFVKQHDSEALLKRPCAPLAWGAAATANASKDTGYRAQAEQFAAALVEQQQDDGQWPAVGARYHLLETMIENAIWLHEIATELSAT